MAPGFYARESHRLVSDAKDGESACLLAHRELNRVAEEVRVILNDLPSGARLPEEVALRRGGTGETMVILAGDTSKENEKVSRDRFNAIAEKIASIPAVVSVAEHIRYRGKKPGGPYITLAAKTLRLV